MSTDQMFGQMNIVALERLAGRDPVLLAKHAGIDYDADAKVLRLSSMGKPLEISWPDCVITPAVSGWHRLLILHYLDLADGTPLSGREMPFSQMNAGMVRGGGIDRKCEQALRSLKDPDGSSFAQSCVGLGGERLRTNADIAYRIPFLPRFPVTVKLWLPDEEFPASGRLLVDESADHYFTIEDAVTVAELLIERLAVPEGQRSFSVQ